MMRVVYWLCAGLIGALGTHLAMVLLIPSVANRDLATVLGKAGPPNTVTLLDPAAAARMIRFADVSARYAVCPFDLTDSSLAIIARPGETPMSVVFLISGGGIFNALNDRASQNGALQIRLLTPEQLRVLTDSEEAPPPSELRILAPEARGVVVIKALAPLPSRAKDAEQALLSTQCGSV